MAIVRAVKSGNWSDTTVWNTGALPTSADDVYSNTFTVTIDTSPTVLSIQNGSATGVTAGGSFVPTNGITLTCTGSGVYAGTTATCVICSLTVGQSCTFVANITTGYYSNAKGVVMAGAGTVNIVGNITYTQTSGANNNLGVQLTGAGQINITGNCTGGGSSAAGLNDMSNINAAVRHDSTGLINITGTIAGGVTNASGAGYVCTGSGTLNHIGICQATSATPAIAHGTSTQVTILSGPFLTVISGMNPVMAYRWFWANSIVTPTYYQIRTANLATIRPLYTADSVGGNPAASNVRSGTVYGPNSELTGTCAVPAAASVVVGVPVDNTTGTAAVTAASIRSALGMASANLDTQLAAIPTTAAPTASAVATAVWQALTSSLSTANSIGALLVANINATISSRSTYDGSDTNGTATLLGRLTSGRAAGLDNLDATMSSRLATSGYTAPPSASSIATAVWANASRTLTAAVYSTSDIASAVWSAVARTVTGGTVDTASNVPSASTVASAVWAAASRTLTAAIDQSSAIASAVWTYASGRTITGGTVDTLTNAPSVPSAVAIASQVRTELSTELSRIDVATSTRSTYSGADTAGTTTLLGRLTSGRASNLDLLDASVASRLAASSYTTPPTAADVAAAVVSGVWGATSRTVTGGTVDNVANATPINNAAIAQAVRSELAPELARVANSATTQEVAEIVQDAIQP